MTRVLWLTFQSPDRNLGGGSLREACLVEGLAQTMEVDLIVATSMNDHIIGAMMGRVTELNLPLRYVEQSRWRRRLSTLSHMFTSRSPFEITDMARFLAPMQTALASAPTHDVVCISHLALAPIVARAAGARWTLDLHHLPSRLSAHNASISNRSRGRWVQGTNVRRARRLEQLAAARCDGLTVCSDEDAAAVGPPAVVIPNGVDTTVFRSTPLPRQHRVVLTGTLGYLPNVDGATWFCSEVWPLVRQQVPDATLELVGKAPIPQVIALGGINGVEVVADVPSVGPHLRAARVAVVPLRMGSGTRIKALEALAAGRPVVGTTVGLEGLGIQSGVQAVVADTPAEFAGAVTTLLRDPAAERMAEAGRRHAELHFDWSDIGSKFADHVERVAAGRGRMSGPA